MPSGQAPGQEKADSRIQWKGRVGGRQRGWGSHRGNVGATHLASHPVFSRWCPARRLGRRARGSQGMWGAQAGLLDWALKAGSDLSRTAEASR